MEWTLEDGRRVLYRNGRAVPSARVTPERHGFRVWNLRGRVWAMTKPGWVFDSETRAKAFAESL